MLHALTAYVYCLVFAVVIVVSVVLTTTAFASSLLVQVTFFQLGLLTGPSLCYYQLVDCLGAILYPGRIEN